jgi:hypothetical protein
MSYIGRYERFIETLKGQKIEGAVEMHHILPKSLGGTNDADNLIALTPRQHYVAHWMLWKIHSGKMAQAFFFMNNHKNYKRMYSRGYERVRAEYIKNSSGVNAPTYGMKTTKEVKKKQSASRKQFFAKGGMTEEMRNQIAALRPSKEGYQKQAKAMSSLVWLNDGVRSYRVKPELVEEKLADGLVHGRLINYIDDSYIQKRKEIASSQWRAVKSTGHTGHLIRV